MQKNKVIITDKRYKWNEHCITDRISIKEFKREIQPELKADNALILIKNPIYKNIYKYKSNCINIPPLVHNTVVYTVGLHIVRTFYFDKDEPDFKGL